MSKKTLFYYGLEVENTPIFKSNIKLEKWQQINEYVKNNGQFLSNSKKVYYYKLNNIDIIETIDNKRLMYNRCNFKMRTINNNYLKLEFNEAIVDYITPEFDYFNKQIHKLQIYNIDNLHICFDEYFEDGNNNYNIYLIVDNENDMNKFIDLINHINHRT
jgi:hypothetical protein